jgi:tRNA U34 2-thiouridine synthase MnmA/TrmU
MMTPLSRFSSLRAKDRDRSKRNNALWVAVQSGIKLRFVDLVEEYRDVVLNPEYGYGANLTPCLDCKIFMVQKAMDWMRAHAFDFIITGEVIGQRPMSQLKDTMPLIQRESEAQDLLLRPLSAKLLAPTPPERAGWVDRASLHGYRKQYVSLRALSHAGPEAIIDGTTRELKVEPFAPHEILEQWTL